MSKVRDLTRYNGSDVTAQTDVHNGSTEVKLRITLGNPKTLKDVLAVYNVLTEKDLVACATFLQSMLRLRPQDRATAAQLLRNEWLQSQ